MWGHFLESFNENLTAQRDKEYQRQREEDAREFQILSTLSQHGSDDIRALAGASLLELARGSAGPRAKKKGLRGFLGEAEQSPYLNSVREALQPQPQTGPSANPNMPASLPAQSPVQPGAPTMAAPSPPPGATAQMPVVPGSPMQMGGAPEGPAMLGATQNTVRTMLPPPPPPPRIRALFPSTEEIAAQQTRGQLTGRLDAFQQVAGEMGMNQAQQQDAVLGMMGAPRRRTNPQPMILTLQDGREVVGIFDPDTQTYEVDDQPVQPISARKPSASAPRAPSLRYFTDKTGTVTAYNPADDSITEIGPLGKPQVPPPQYSGTATVMDEETGQPVIRRLPRDGGGVVVGKAPPRAGVVTEETKRYRSWYEAFKAERAQRQKGYMGAQKLTQQQLDKIAEDVSGVKGMTMHELQMGAQGASQERGGKSGLKKSEVQGLVDDLAKRMGLAPSAPRPPK